MTRCHPRSVCTNAVNPALVTRPVKPGTAPDSGSYLGGGFEKLAAPGCRMHVVERFGERPAMPREILYLVLAFTVRNVCRLHDDARAVPSSPLTMGSSVVNPHQHRVGDLARPRGTTLHAYVANDHGAITGVHLRAMVLSDADAFREPERVGQPRHRGSYVRIDQHGNDRGRRDRSIRSHEINPTPGTAQPT